MNDPWLEPPSPPPVYGVPLSPPSGPPPRRKRWAVVVAVLVLLGMALVLIVPYTVGRSVPPTPTPHVGWDQRVWFAVDAVERFKGRPFDRPVTVVFQADAEFEQGVVASRVPDDEDDAGDDHSAGVMRAFGLMTGDVDPAAEGESLARTQILAYYEERTETVKVRGTEIDVAVQATLVHELVHAWQDQHHELGHRDGVTDSEARLAYTMAVEGDAERVSAAWVDDLPDDRREEYDAIESQPSADPDGGPEDISPFVSANIYAPYRLGPAFLDALEADGRSVDEALEVPAPDSATILRPWTFGEPPDRDPVVLPSPGAGTAEVDADSLGAFDLYVMLADRIDPRVALRAADAWSGDRYRVVTGEDGTVCVEGRIAARDASAAADLGGAMTAWDDAFQNGRVTLHPDDAGVTYEACDPGAETAITVPGRPDNTVRLLELRLYVWAAARYDGRDRDEARCESDAVVWQVTAIEVEREEPLSQKRYEELRRIVRNQCR
jgi:hypothetical protein